MVSARQCAPPLPVGHSCAAGPPTRHPPSLPPKVSELELTVQAAEARLAAHALELTATRAAAMAAVAAPGLATARAAVSALVPRPHRGSAGGGGGGRPMAGSQGGSSACSGGGGAAGRGVEKPLGSCAVQHVAGRQGQGGPGVAGGGGISLGGWLADSGL